MEDIQIRLDESEKFEDWGRETDDFFKGFGNIMLVASENNLLGLNISLKALDERNRK